MHSSDWDGSQEESSQEQARLLYYACVVPSYLYAADVFIKPLIGRHPSGRPKGSTGIANMLQRVHRQMALFISGAMRTTATDVACLHANLPPFKVLVNILCQRAILRMATLPDSHPLRACMVRAAYYVQRHRSPLHELIHAFNTRTGEIETIGNYRPSPARAPTLETIIHSRAEAARFDRQSRAQVRLYSDGSAHNGGVGAAAVLMRAGASPRILRMYLGTADEHTVYEAELVGMGLAMELLRTERGRFTTATLGVDNQAALQSTAITRPRPGHHIVQKVEPDRGGCPDETPEPSTTGPLDARACRHRRQRAERPTGQDCSTRTIE